MNDRFRFRVPFFNNDDKFIGYMYCDMINGIKAYNAGICYKGDIQLSTGLKDKNGKLIYEGDIVQYDFGKNNSYINGIVKGKVFWNKTKWDIDCCFFDLEDYIPEVIGNIYENKELLGIK